jgi:hypothetical protein
MNVIYNWQLTVTINSLAKRILVKTFAVTAGVGKRGDILPPV